MIIDIPCGASSLKLSISRKRLLGVLKNEDYCRPEVTGLFSGRLGFEDAIIGKNKILIVAADATRKAHLKEILAGLLKKISSPSRNIDIIIATGLHKKHTAAQLRKLLGALTLKRCRVLQHNACDGSVMNLGTTELGIPITLNKSLFEHDFLISIGVIEPHLYAGYSGGAKTIAIGLAGRPTINATHGVRFLDDKATRIGSLAGNKFQETLWHILAKIQPVFSINTVNSPDGKALKVFSGPVGKVFKDGTNFAKKVFEVKVEGQADIVICGIGHPKDVNLYQASRAINYILDVERPILKKGGVLIVAAALKEGAGYSSAEKRFYGELKKMRSPEDLVRRVKRDGCIAGEHRAYMVARGMLRHEIILVTKKRGDFRKKLPFKCVDKLSDAMRQAERIMGSKAKVYIVPRSLATITSFR